MWNPSRDPSRFWACRIPPRRRRSRAPTATWSVSITPTPITPTPGKRAVTFVTSTTSSPHTSCSATPCAVPSTIAGTGRIPSARHRPACRCATIRRAVPRISGQDPSTTSGPTNCHESKAAPSVTAGCPSRCACRSAERRAGGVRALNRGRRERGIRRPPTRNRPPRPSSAHRRILVRRSSGRSASRRPGRPAPRSQGVR